MTQPNSPDIVPVPTNPEVSSSQALPPSRSDVSTPPLPITDDSTSLSESLDDTEFTTEDAPRSDSPQKVFPAEWVVPTSGELAFLAGLPQPTVGFDDDEAPVPSSADSVPLGVEQLEEQTHLADTAADQSAPVAETDDVFNAASRQWNAAMNEAILHRRDTWAVGKRWIRHIRIIEVGDRSSGDASRKKSC